LTASLLLFLIPKRFFNVISTAGHAPTSESVILRDNLQLLSSALFSAESTLRALTSTKAADDAALRETMYSRTSRRVCSRCGLRKYCWGRDTKNTKTAMEDLERALNRGEKPTAELAPSHCIRPDTFAAEFGKMYDIYSSDKIWSDRRRELQATLCTGLSGINGVVASLIKQSGETSLCDELLADDIRSRLRHAGIDASEIYVTGNEEDTEVRMVLRECGGLGRCEDAVPKVLEEATGLRFAKTGLKNCNSCRCRYVVAPDFDVEAAVASAVKENRRISGDFSTCCLLDRNTFAMTLCDGMGSGDEAARESRLCATLLISLLEAGMDAEAAINLTNSLIIGSGVGSYTAIDLCIAELGGTAKLYKCGGASTYLRQGKGAEEFAPGGLPVGASAKSGAECYERSMEDESTLVLISDGVALSGNGHSEWIKELIEHGGLATPQKLASEILNRARDKSGGVPRDDLTVIAANITRRKQA
ncbi:MAG: SpoIIE family protein phosphatase, partial [Clostridia bacterium]